MKIINVIIQSVFLMFLFACNKNELDLYPRTSLTGANSYKTETQLTQAVNDVYRLMRVIYNAQGIVRP